MSVSSSSFLFTSIASALAGSVVRTSSVVAARSAARVSWSLRCGFILRRASGSLVPGGGSIVSGAWRTTSVIGRSLMTSPVVGGSRVISSGVSVLRSSPGRVRSSVRRSSSRVPMLRSGSRLSPHNFVSLHNQFGVSSGGVYLSESLQSRFDGQSNSSSDVLASSLVQLELSDEVQTKFFYPQREFLDSESTEEVASLSVVFEPFSESFALESGLSPSLDPEFVPSGSSQAQGSASVQESGESHLQSVDESIEPQLVELE